LSIAVLDPRYRQGGEEDFFASQAAEEPVTNTLTVQVGTDAERDARRADENLLRSADNFRVPERFVDDPIHGRISEDELAILERAGQVGERAPEGQALGPDGQMYDQQELAQHATRGTGPYEVDVAQRPPPTVLEFGSPEQREVRFENMREYNKEQGIEMTDEEILARLDASDAGINYETGEYFIDEAFNPYLENYSSSEGQDWMARYNRQYQYGQPLNERGIELAGRNHFRVIAEVDVAGGDFDAMREKAADVVRIESAAVTAELMGYESVYDFFTDFGYGPMDPAKYGDGVWQKMDIQEGSDYMWGDGGSYYPAYGGGGGSYEPGPPDISRMAHDWRLRIT